MIGMLLLISLFECRAHTSNHFHSRPLTDMLMLVMLLPAIVTIVSLLVGRYRDMRSVIRIVSALTLHDELNRL